MRFTRLSLFVLALAPTVLHAAEAGLVGGKVTEGQHLTVEAGFENKMMKFWLLNKQGVDATTYESALGFEVRRAGKKSFSECRVQVNHFACPDPKGWSFKKGDEIVLTVSRNKSPFEELKMQWPLPNVKQPAVVAAGPSYEEVQAKAKETNDHAQAKQMKVEQARKNYRIDLPPAIMNLMQAVRGTGARGPAAAGQGDGCGLPD
ncbi:MAG: hypothetical protein KF681_12875 [Bdellovibrionaceae bacterium]|nr:hypothetical protein [Pseudobdellovibrionaceae bacterium]